MEAIQNLKDTTPIYASCLLVSPSRESMLLIRKNRPDWQAGQLNIIGGHVEQNEDPKEAAIREVLEEVGFFLDPDEVAPFCVLDTLTPGPARVYFFVAEVECIHAFTQKTDEEPVVVDIDYVVDAPDVIPNLKYLVPMAVDKDHPFGMIYESTS